MALHYSPSTIVRAYDLGGFGDIAGAMRVASFLHRTGVDVEIKAKSTGALQKLQILNPDVSFSLNGTKSTNGTIQLDIAGHYGDDRNPMNRDVPHHFTEDMDNPENRRKVVPIYMKTGLTQSYQHVPVQFNGHNHNPMFYRPFREWDLPKPGQRDARAQIIKALSRKKGLTEKAMSLVAGSRLERTIEAIQKIGFVHLSPSIQTLSGDYLLEHPYFYSVHTAAMHYSPTYGLGIFVNRDVELKLAQAALRKHWGVVSSNGEVIKYDPDIPTLIFMGSQPQMTTTSLFLAADIPNLVTGDLSLSDALYALIAMGGQGFFYETPGWKMPTHVELIKILGNHHPALANMYFVGSNFLKVVKEEKPLVDQAMDRVIVAFGDKKQTQAYADYMREAVRAEIRKRFGEVTVEVAAPKDGFYIPPGAPYLLQDATAQVVKTLHEDPDAFAEIEGIRKMLKDGVPVTISVSTGALIPAPLELELTYNPSSLLIDYPSIKKSKWYKKNNLESIIFEKISTYKDPFHIFTNFKSLDKLYGNISNIIYEKPKYAAFS